MALELSRALVERCLVMGPRIELCFDPGFLLMLLGEWWFWFVLYSSCHADRGSKPGAGIAAALIYCGIAASV